MKKVIAIVGATASGKTSYSIELAKKIDGEIISASILRVQNPHLRNEMEFLII